MNRKIFTFVLLIQHVWWSWKRQRNLVFISNAFKNTIEYSVSFKVLPDEIRKKKRNVCLIFHICIYHTYTHTHEHINTNKYAHAYNQIRWIENYLGVAMFLLLYWKIQWVYEKVAMFVLNYAYKKKTKKEKWILVS